MSRDDHGPREASTRLFCDLTQSWSEVGGGVRTYLLHKRRHILEKTPHRHLLIIPGEQDTVTEDGRAITVTIRSRHVPGSPNYRLLLRNGAVRKALEQFRPDLIECQDAYNLPWAAIGHRNRFPQVALVAAYMTDFPTVYGERPLARLTGHGLAGLIARSGYAYAGALYRRFDALYALSENGGAAKLRALGVPNVDVIPLGVEIGEFGPGKRSPELRRKLGIAEGQPLIVYAGRLDGEKKPNVVVSAFRKLPAALGARLALLGEGPLKPEIARLGDDRIVMPGYVRDRAELAQWLASADIYASGMADETFGISIIEAQASGLPVVGVSAGAMIDRVPPSVGRLGPVGDADAMAANILAVWSGDHVAMAKQAREHALQFSWDRCMDELLGNLYPKAIAHRSTPVGSTSKVGVPAVS